VPNHFRPTSIGKHKMTKMRKQKMGIIVVLSELQY
jgi:hypothetical protein